MKKRLIPAIVFVLTTTIVVGLAVFFARAAESVPIPVAYKEVTASPWYRYDYRTSDTGELQNTTRVATSMSAFAADVDGWTQSAWYRIPDDNFADGSKLLVFGFKSTGSTGAADLETGIVYDPVTGLVGFSAPDNFKNIKQTASITRGDAFFLYSFTGTNVKVWLNGTCVLTADTAVDLTSRLKAASQNQIFLNVYADYGAKRTFVSHFQQYGVTLVCAEGYAKPSTDEAADRFYTEFLAASAVSDPDALATAPWYRLSYQYGLTAIHTETVGATPTEWTRESVVYIPAETVFTASDAIGIFESYGENDGFWNAGIRYMPLSGTAAPTNSALFPIMEQSRIAVPATGFVHFVETFDGTCQRVYINGTLALTATVSPDFLSLVRGDRPHLMLGGYAGPGTLSSGARDVCSSLGVRVMTSSGYAVAASAETVAAMYDAHTEITYQLAAPFDDAEHLTLVRDGITQFRIVYASTSKSDVSSAINDLNSKIQTLTGIRLPTSLDTAGWTGDNNAPEILIGKTNRALSDTVASALNRYEYAIRVTDSQIAIVAESEDDLADAIRYFITNYLTGSYIVSESGNLKIEKGIDYRTDGSAFYLENLLPTSSSFTSTPTQLYLTPFATSSVSLMVQGGCAVGKYYYYACIDDTATKDYIVKYNMSTKAVKKTSAPLNLGHANDMTYNSKTGELIVAHNAPDRTRLSFLDPDTLELIRTIDIGYRIYAIDYNALRDCYVIGNSGGQTFSVLDADFNLIAGPYSPTDATDGDTTQGYATDDHFIYHVLFKDAEIAVYDWSGNFVTIITLKMKPGEEPEHIFIQDNVIYVGCAKYGYGGVLYRITPVK